MDSLEELIEASQTWAARQIKESVEYIRQRRFNPFTSMYLYFWNDPWPCLGGSGLLDYFGRKYKAYDVYPYVYTPVMVSIEWVKEPFIVGHEKLYKPGEPFKANIWVTNDTDNGFSGAKLTWQIKGPDKKILKHDSSTLDVQADSSKIVQTRTWPIPKEDDGLYRMEVQLHDGQDNRLSRNYFEFRVEE
jgi:beta-mannosidase